MGLYHTCMVCSTWNSDDKTSVLWKYRQQIATHDEKMASIRTDNALSAASVGFASAERWPPVTPTHLRIDGKPYAQLQPALDYLAPLEGGFSDHVADRGGATKWGISLRFLGMVAEGDLNSDGHVDLADIHAMTPVQRDALYAKYFWEHYRLFNIRSQLVANRVFSIYVNMRSQDAALVVQRACCAAQRPVKMDGQVGSKTFEAINSANEFELVTALRSEQASIYQRIALFYPDQVVNLEGWLNRAYRF